MNTVTSIVIYVICFLPMMVIFSVMPYIGRRTLSFGISIPQQAYKDEKLALLRKTFSRNVIVYGMLFGMISFVLYLFVEEQLAISLLNGFVFLYIIILGILYVRSWKAVKQIKAEKGWKDTAHETMVADTRFKRTKRAVSPMWFLIYAVIILATVVLGVMLYDQMPDQVPTKIDITGNVIRMAEKSSGLIMFAPAIQAIFAVVFGFTYFMIQRTPPVIDPDNPEVSSKQNTIFRYRWTAFSVFGGMLLLLIFVFVPLWFANLIETHMVGWIVLPGAGILVVSAIVLAVITGQSGSRIRVGKTSDGKVIRRDDDKYWKYGSFYVNKDDPALFVEKRFGIGFTINFGRPAAIIIFVGFLVLIFGVVALTTILVK